VLLEIYLSNTSISLKSELFLKIRKCFEAVRQRRSLELGKRAAAVI
jgi:hypothetical protein